MMEFIVKDHNRIAYEKAVEAFKTSRKTCCVHATGTGKAYIALQFIRDVECKVIYVTSYAANLAAFRDNVANYFGDKINNVEFLIYRNLKQFNETDDHTAGLIILDEMHRAGADGWGQQVDILLDNNPNAKVLGLTATAVRYLDDERDMSRDLFDGNVCSEINLVDAIAGGILKAPSYYCCVYSFKDEIAAAEAMLHANKLTKNEDRAKTLINKAKRLLEESDGLPEFFSKYMKNKHGKYIVFCSNGEHMSKMKEESAGWFSGINTKIYSMFSTNSDSMEQLKLFEGDSSNCLRLLFCVSMLNEGVHVDGVDGVIMLRPTASLNVYFQQLGRCLSTGAADHPVVFDIVNNSATLKPVRKMMTEISNLNSNKGESIVPDFEVFGRDENIIECLNEFYDIVAVWNKWTEDEDDLIKKLYFNDREKLERLLKDRSKKAILWRANLLGLRNKRQYWTDEEDAIIKEYYPTEGKNVSYRLLNRSKLSVKGRARKLGVDFTDTWTDQEDIIMKKYYPIEGQNVMLKLNNKSIAAVKGRAKKLGLKVLKNEWTPQEDLIMQEYYPTEGSDVGLRLHGKSKKSIVNRAIKLGVKYSKGKWTDKENDILKKYYPIEGRNVARRFKDRTPRSVIGRAQNVLGLKCVKGCESQHGWTDNEDLIMNEYYPIEGANIVSRLNGRTLYAVKNRARILGLRIAK